MNDKHLINVKYIPEKKTFNPANNSYNNPIGVWHVTTEGDVEGYTTKDLGVWYGHVCNIAFHLAHKSSYKLEFTPVSSMNYSTVSGVTVSKNKNVDISMNIDSNTWNLTPKNRVKWFENFLNLDNSSNIEVKESNYYAAVSLKLKI
jgi:hypothetical protein